MAEPPRCPGGRIHDIRYNAFGATRSGGTTTPTDKRFTGQTPDLSTGLYWYGSRAYDPVLGRFVQPDTIVPDYKKPQSLNRYSYVFNNPVRFTDPSGNWPEDEEPYAQSGSAGDAASQYRPDTGYAGSPDEGDPEAPEAAAGSFAERMSFWEEASSAAIAYEFRGPEMWAAGPTLTSYDPGGPPLASALSMGEREAMPYGASTGPGLSDWVQASGEAATAVSDMLNIPNLDTEATYAASGTLLLVGGSKFMPWVGPGIFAAQLLAAGWSAVAPGLARGLKSVGM